MTDRVRALTVVLDDDYREDDAEVIVQAVRMIKGVGTVGTNVVNVQDYMNRASVRQEIACKLHQAVAEICTPDSYLAKKGKK